MKTNLYRLLAFVALLLIALTACATAQAGPVKAEIPADKAYANGKEIYFVHTEASDADSAKKMTDMFKSPVMHVPSLSQVPDSALGKVYFFSNGVKGAGALGFQLSVFDNPPGTDGYTPLRRANVVTWVDASKARELKLASDIVAAEKSGELKITQLALVINMPFVVWDGGKR
jgi:hypothetical protein